MLHCNMKSAMNLQLGLEDLLADLRHSRRQGDLGRLALISYCEVRRWAREAGEAELAELSSGLISSSPHASRETFLAHIDHVIFDLERARLKFAESAGGRVAEGPRPAVGRGALTA